MLYQNGLAVVILRRKFCRGFKIKFGNDSKYQKKKLIYVVPANGTRQNWTFRFFRRSRSIGYSGANSSQIDWDWALELTTDMKRQFFAVPDDLLLLLIRVLRKLEIRSVPKYDVGSQKHIKKNRSLHWECVCEGENRAKFASYFLQLPTETGKICAKK